MCRLAMRAAEPVPPSRLRLGEHRVMPCVVGWLRPRILLPRGTIGKYDAEEAGVEVGQVVRRGRDRFSQEILGACSFVDLIGENGWAA